jgi:hypothetical protein
VADYVTMVADQEGRVWMIKTAVQNWKSWAGFSLAIFHAVLLAGLIWAKEPLPPYDPCFVADKPFPSAWEGNLAGVSVIAGRSFHLSYETPLLQFLMIADIPGELLGLLATMLLWLPLQAVELSNQTLSYLAGLHWLIFGSLQWWLIGSLLETKLKPKLQLKRHLTQ